MWALAVVHSSVDCHVLILNNEVVQLGQPRDEWDVFGRVLRKNYSPSSPGSIFVIHPGQTLDKKMSQKILQVTEELVVFAVNIYAAAFVSPTLREVKQSKAASWIDQFNSRSTSIGLKTSMKR
jgi:hypothetical protein